MFSCVRVIALLFALLASAASAQVIPSGPWGSINYWGVGGASQVLNPGTAGQCLETQGGGSAPIWVACPGSSLALLPPINTNQFYGNVSGNFQNPVGVDVNTILNTVGYDIARPPTVESILYKSNVGPTFNWQALPPGPLGTQLTSGGPTNPPFWATPAQASLSSICQTVGAILYFDTPSLLWKCLNPGTSGQVLQTGGASGNPSWLTLAASATTDTTNAANISSGTLPAGRMPALTGDCTTSVGAVATTCTKTNGVVFATSATTDTTNAANITSGTLPAGRMPALTGDATTSVGTVATTVVKVNGNTPGGACTNQFTRSINSSAVPTCASIANADMPAYFHVETTPAAQIGNATSTLKMNGYASGVSVFTPAVSGKVRITLSTFGQNNTATDGCLVQMAFGTGNGPANAAAATGTVLTTAQGATSSTASAQVPIATTGFISGLTPAQPYWVDFQVSNTGGGTCSLGSATIAVDEMP